MPTDRGERLAAGAVALTVLTAVLNGRFGTEWGQGIHLVYTAAAAIFVVSQAAASPRPSDGPAGWQSVLFVTSFVLVFGTLTNLADVLGADDPPFGASGTVVWTGLLLVALMYWFASNWNSGISTLLMTVTLIAVIVAAIDWVFSPEDADTFRWILLLIAAGFAAVAMMRRPTDPRHAVGWMNASGIALFLLAGTFLVQTLLTGLGSALGGGSGSDIGWGWELALLVGAAVLIAWSVTLRQAGPGYLGVLNLVAYVSFAATPGEDGPSLIGWPLLLLIVTGGLLAMSRGNGAPGAGVPVRPSPDPSESPTAVQPGS